MKSLLKNYLALGILLLVLNIVFGLILGKIFILINVQGSTSSTVSGLMAAYILGYIYSQNFKEVMPSKIRIKSLIVYAIPQALFLYSLASGLGNSINLFVAIMLVLTPIYFLILYWMLGFSGKTYLKQRK